MTGILLFVFNISFVHFVLKYDSFRGVTIDISLFYLLLVITLLLYLLIS